MKKTPNSAAGFTLLELLTSATIAVVAVAAASVALTTQYRAMQSVDLARGANTQSRAAMTRIESSLRELGWGIDPRYAIDMKYAKGAAGATCTPPCRDHYNAPDELVFVARNPYYRWRAGGDNGCPSASTGGCYDGNSWPATAMTAGTPKTITATIPNAVTLEEGRVILLTCATGTSAVMITVASTTTGAGAGTVITPLATNAIPYNDWTSLVACHGTTGASVFLVDRYHYYLDTGTYSVPWLMFDTGLYPSAGGDIYPLAKDVEDIQVAYGLTPSTLYPAPDTNADWVLGNDTSSAAAEEPDFDAGSPGYSTSLTASSRFTKNPANVRAIRVTLRLRSDRTDQTHPSSWTGDTLVYPENHAQSGSLSGGRYRRYTAETEVTLRNLDSTSPFTF